MTIKRLIGSDPSQISRNKDLGTMAFQDVSLVKGPSFSAYKSSTNQSLSANTWTKITFETENWDTNNCFTNSTFTPNVAGIYLVLVDTALTVGSGFQVAIYKNGVFYRGSDIGDWNHTMGLVQCNGTTDYIEVYINIGASSGSVYLSATLTTFSAALIRGA